MTPALHRPIPPLLLLLLAPFLAPFLAPAQTATPLSIPDELTKPSLEVCLNATDEAAAKKFFGEGLGLSERILPRVVPGANTRQMLLFPAGPSTIKVRLYDQPPAKLPTDLAARNGFRLLTVPVEKLDEVAARLRQLGFECGEVKETGGVRSTLARNADGTAFELIETKADAERVLEIGLVVPDLAKAREFFTNVHGAKELPEMTSRVLPGEKELRFTTGGTVFKCWAPAGEREPDTGKIPDVLGFRYITHNVRDLQRLHDVFSGRGVEIATPMTSHLGTASLFMARGPGGVLLEFISFGKTAAQKPAAMATPTPQPPAMAGGAAAEPMFKRLDRDGDGKISPQEVPNAERFKSIDSNTDGFISTAELGAALAKQSGGTAPAPKPSAPANPNAPESNLPKDRPFLGLRFATDYHAALQAAGSPLSKATEANALESHAGQLFCATSYMPPSQRIGDTQPMILVKKSASGPWEVDYQGPPEFNRIAILRSVKFTTDGSGQKLPQPVSVLVAGTGAWRSVQPKGVMVLSRDDSTGQWHTHTLSTDIWNPEKVNHSQETRMLFDHVDRVTGVHSVFAGSATGRLYRGVYDPTAPGLIKWDAKPELEGLVGNFLCAAEANGAAYFGVAYGPIASNERMTTERPVKDHGLFRRVDGAQARWEWVPVKEWEDPRQPGRSLRTSQLRGLTAAPAPDGKGEVLLVAWDTRDAVIERIAPLDGFKATVELNVRDFLAESWGRRVGVSSFAYNDMLPVTHPDDGEKAHLIGLWVVDPRGESDAIAKSSWYLARYPDGSYQHQRIWDEKNPLTDAQYGMRGCRSIRPSPFPEEAGRVFYFCGFDQTGAKGGGATGPTAWVYQGTLPSWPAKKVIP
jgi:catechol 2,3-dioxygenase-like lactoylglutathione lyase family enzyme